MIFEKSLKQNWFDLIKSGLKTVEGRLNKGDFANIKPGDLIHFYSNKDTNKSDLVKTLVVSIKEYNTFREMITKERLKYVLPGIKTINDGVLIYDSIYPKEIQQNYKVLAIRLKLM
jgi:ASC-1-like (ASCH) protein